jgi:hypothetical protein
LQFFDLPIPSNQLLNLDTKVKLRVTLSYFAEPNTVRRTLYRGLDLEWDMQGPAESTNSFAKRINMNLRAPKEEIETASFGWEVGIQRRSRGTVQSDRWTGPASHLAGKKRIAVYPILGWWNVRKQLQFQQMNFSLVISIEVPEVPIYTFVKSALIPLPLSV